MGRGCRKKRTRARHGPGVVGDAGRRRIRARHASPLLLTWMGCRWRRRSPGTRACRRDYPGGTSHHWGRSSSTSAACHEAPLTDCNSAIVSLANGGSTRWVVSAVSSWIMILNPAGIGMSNSSEIVARGSSSSFARNSSFSAAFSSRCSRICPAVFIVADPHLWYGQYPKSQNDARFHFLKGGKVIGK